jgi:glycerol-3-phosphate dehydrogenase (NAD(P)+)
METEGRNAKYLSDVEFDTSLITATSDINEVVRNCEIILIAAPSAFLAYILAELDEPLDNKFILSATKGIIEEEYTTITEYFKNKYGLHYTNLGLISGPSHAEEVSRDKLSYLTVACKSEENARLIGEMFKSKYIMVAYSQDIYGIEYAAILKNIYALAGGLAYGLGYGDNFRAVLTAASAKELTRFINESYPFERDTTDSAYLGDLLVTSYSSFSRNRRLGQLIGNGCTVKSALNELTMVAEGYYASACIKKINDKHGISMPIADMVYNILYCRANPRRSMKALTELL